MGLTQLVGEELIPVISPFKVLMSFNRVMSNKLMGIGKRFGPGRALIGSKLLFRLQLMNAS
jgi:hypothetical protein